MNLPLGGLNSNSGDSWMYPDPNVGPLWEIPIEALYYVVIFPKNPRTPAKYHGGTRTVGIPNNNLRDDIPWIW